jgi:hypothetical protein
MPAGDYEITVTAAGDPSTVLLKSQSLSLPAGRYSSFVIAAEQGASNNPISVIAIGDVASVFVNVNAPASVRVINAAADQAPRDIAVDSQFAPPLFAAVPFATETAYATVPTSGALKFNVTPPGNPGTLELDTTLATGPTAQYTVLLSGMPGALSQVSFVDDNRRVPALGRVRFYDAAPQIPSIDFFLVPTGTDLSTVLADASLLPPSGSETAVPPGSYELWASQTGTTTIVAGPIPLTIEPSSLYGILATNNANGVTADITLLDDFL